MPSIVYLLFALYVALTAVFIVTENRRPQTTFAWMLLFVSFPGFGLAIYFLFGRSRRPFSRQQKLQRQDLQKEMAQLLAPLLPQHEEALRAIEAENDAGPALAKLVRHTSHSSLTTRNEVELLQDADEAYPRLLEDIRNARSFIHLQFFSWSSDEFGQELKTILLEKASEGVQVRLLYDPIGSLFRLRWRYVAEMRRGGVRMHPWSRLWSLHTLGYRNHRKIVVIDGTVGHTGGMNIGREHIKPEAGFTRWRDTNLRIVGAAAAVLQAVFAVDWRNAVGEDVLEPEFFPPMDGVAEGGSIPVQITVSGPDSEWAVIRQLYFSMIVAARQHVYMQSPFFILDASITEALKVAALKGVDVRIMLSRKGMGQVVPYWAAYTYMEEIAAAGGRIFLYDDGYLHSKTISIDSQICSIGSTNIDIRSFSINYELNAVIYDKQVTAELEADFRRDLEGCVEFTVRRYRKARWWLRFRNSVARLFSPLL